MTARRPPRTGFHDAPEPTRTAPPGAERREREGATAPPAAPDVQSYAPGTTGDPESAPRSRWQQAASARTGGAAGAEGSDRTDRDRTDGADRAGNGAAAATGGRCRARTAGDNRGSAPEGAPVRSRGPAGSVGRLRRPAGSPARDGGAADAVSGGTGAERSAPAGGGGPVSGPVFAPDAGARAAAGGEPAESGEPGSPVGPAEPERARPVVRPAGRRVTADPVKELMHCHRRLCARAVDPLEIAAGLEAQGMTDRTAARFRHRDVFSLAEELYARVPREASAGAAGTTGAAGGAGPAADPSAGPGPDRQGSRGAHDPYRSDDPCPPHDPYGTDGGCVPGERGPGARRHRAGVRLLWRVRYLLPAAGCAATVLALRAAAEGRLAPAPAPAPAALAEPAVAVPVIAAVGATLVACALWLCLRRGPLSVRHGGVAHPGRAGAGRSGAARAGLWACWLLAYALAGDVLLTELLGGGPDSLRPAAGPAAAMTLTGLALAVGPAAWCARWFGVRARRALTDSRGPADFAAAVRPLVPAAVVMLLAVLPPLLLLARALPGGASGGVAGPAGPGSAAGGVLVAGGAAVALGGLLFLARLLAVHGHGSAGSAGVAAAAAAEAAALASTLAARLPLSGFGRAGRPVETAVAAYGPAVVPLTACAAAGLALLVYATAVLSRTASHAGVTGTPAPVPGPAGPDLPGIR